MMPANGRLRASSPRPPGSHELGPEPAGTEADLWRQERWGAVVLLAGLADDDTELLRKAANGVAALTALPA